KITKELRPATGELRVQPNLLFCAGCCERSEYGDMAERTYRVRRGSSFGCGISLRGERIRDSSFARRSPHWTTGVPSAASVVTLSVPTAAAYSRPESAGHAVAFLEDACSRLPWTRDEVLS